MEKIANAWLAYQNEPGRIELPGGWSWSAESDTIGYLITPDGQRCVGYDIAEETMRFGADGGTKAPGLNLWTAQEMGEKFARENFMGDELGKAYDEFAKERRAARSEYEKAVRGELTGLIQMELKEGMWTAHVNSEGVLERSGIEAPSELTREAGISLFNKMSVARHVMPLRDPMGYMTLNGNTYDYIKEQYDFQYGDTIDAIEGGLINGNGRGCEAILNKLDATVRKNIREYCLPDGVNYQDLRYVAVTPEIKKSVDDFVRQRVTQTVNFEKKRSHSKESLEKDKEKFLAAGEVLKEQIGEATLPPMNVSLTQTDGIAIK